jgi:hypothetical protein
VFGLSCDVDARVEEGAVGWVVVFISLLLLFVDQVPAGPRTLCNACGLVYAKMVRCFPAMVMFLNLQTTRLKNERGTRTKVMVMPMATVMEITVVPSGKNKGLRMGGRTTVLRDTGMGRGAARLKRGEEQCLPV